MNVYYIATCFKCWGYNLVNFLSYDIISYPRYNEYQYHYQFTYFILVIIDLFDLIYHVEYCNSIYGNEMKFILWPVNNDNGNN